MGTAVTTTDNINNGTPKQLHCDSGRCSKSPAKPSVNFQETPQSAAVRQADPSEPCRVYPRDKSARHERKRKNAISKMKHLKVLRKELALYNQRLQNQLLLLQIKNAQREVFAFSTITQALSTGNYEVIDKLRDTIHKNEN